MNKAMREVVKEYMLSRANRAFEEPIKEVFDYIDTLEADCQAYLAHDKKVAQDAHCDECGCYWCGLFGEALDKGK